MVGVAGEEEGFQSLVSNGVADVDSHFVVELEVIVEELELGLAQVQVALAVLVDLVGNVHEHVNEVHEFPKLTFVNFGMNCIIKHPR